MMYFMQIEYLLIFYICFQQKKKSKWYIYIVQINEIHILHLFESCHVYIKIYLSGPIGEEENVAKS